MLGVVGVGDGNCESWVEGSVIVSGLDVGEWWDTCGFPDVEARALFGERYRRSLDGIAYFG